MASIGLIIKKISSTEEETNLDWLRVVEVRAELHEQRRHEIGNLIRRR